MRALWRASIWHPDAIPATEGTASAELKRYVLPAFDFLMIIMGIAGITRGMPSFAQVYDAAVSTAAGWPLLLGAVLALFGIAFPRFWIAEAAGKLAILVIIGGYATALWVLTFQGVGERWVVAVAFTALLLLPAWTLYRLGRERRAREAGKGVT